MTTRCRAVALIVSLLCCAAVACAPGGGTRSPGAAPTGPVNSDPATAGKLTLVVWDQNTDPGPNGATERLNGEFQRRYPNVTIQRVVRKLDDLKTTLKLALSSENPPDVVQANQGYPDMGAFVRADLLQPLDRFATVYGWPARYPAQLLDLNRFSPDGKTWGAGNLYGVSQTGEVVGVFYNKSQLRALGLNPPATFADLRRTLPVIAAAGKLPIQFGNQDKTPGLHLLGLVQAATCGKDEVRNLVFGRGDLSWTAPGMLEAAQVVRDWAADGYLGTGFNGKTEDQSVADFARGDGVFMLNGTWHQQALAPKMGTNVGFVALAPSEGAPPLAQGGEGVAWSITAKTRHADVAAAYLNFLVDENGGRAAFETGNLPAVLPAGVAPQPGTLAEDVVRSWRAISADDGLVPYLDYATPTFYNTVSGGIQELLAGQIGAQQFVQALQDDYRAFRSGQGR